MQRVGKINTVFALWTFGRIVRIRSHQCSCSLSLLCLSLQVRGALLIISIQDNWQQTLNSTYLSMVVVCYVRSQFCTEMALR